MSGKQRDIVLYALEGRYFETGELKDEILPGLACKFGSALLTEASGFIKFCGSH